MKLSRNVMNDIKALRGVGFDGIMSCQTHRAAFPTALPNTALGELLFDTSIETESYTDEYFRSNFGADYESAKEYLGNISNLYGSFDGIILRKAKIFGDKTLGDTVALTPSIVDDFSATVEKNLTLDDPCHRESWKILKYHGEYCKRLSKVYFALSRNDIDGAKAYFDEMIDYFSEVEMEIHPYFDLCLFRRMMKNLIAGK